MSILDADYTALMSTDNTESISLFAMNTFADRLRWAIQNKGMTQSELARICKIHRATVSLWLTGRTKEIEGTNLANVADALAVRSTWLATGKGERTYQAITGTTDTAYDVNVSPGPDIKGMVPLISWVQAGLFCEAPDLLAPGDAMDWLPCVQKLGPHAYALRVQGDSMTATYGRSYPEGCIIFVDPDAAVTNGCRVIAKIPDANEATFKVYSEDAGKRYLKPLNTQYPIIEMTEAMTLCGVVKGYYMPE